MALNGAVEFGVGEDGCSGICGAFNAACSGEAGESGFETDSSLNDASILRLEWELAGPGYCRFRY